MASLFDTVPSGGLLGLPPIKPFKIEPLYIEGVGYIDLGEGRTMSTKERVALFVRENNRIANYHIGEILRIARKNGAVL